MAELPPPPYTERVSSPDTAPSYTPPKTLRVPSQTTIPSASASAPSSSSATLPPRPAKGLTKLGQHIKDKATHSTHAERSAERAKRRAAEAALAERHRQYRAAETRANETGMPQFIGTTAEGKDIYMEPYYGGQYERDPQAKYFKGEAPYPAGYGYGYGPGYGYGGYGYGYGGGLGLPLGLGLGGLLLGEALFF